MPGGVMSKKTFNWQTLLGGFLIILSSAIYFIHYLIFRDAHHIFIYLIGDIAFVFLEVFLVTLVLHRLLLQREKEAVFKKLNMVIGTFFSEAGTELLKRCSSFDAQASTIASHLIVNKDWSNKEFAGVHKELCRYEGAFEAQRGDMEELKKFLTAKRLFLLNLLENPNLLEHESFTNLLWAVFHLADELSYRAELKDLPPADYQHLSLDIKRVYHQLILQWLEYMKHLKRDYPYLFSLAMRTNPFDPNASVRLS